VRPGETVEFEVTAAGSFDKQNIDARIKGEFGGKGSLDPVADPLDPPAQFTFVAGEEVGDKGTIELEQIGVRGIGKKTIEFTVAGTDYRGQWGGQRISGFIKYCGQTENPYWSVEFEAAGDRGWVAFDILPGATGPVAGEVVTPFIVPGWQDYIDQTTGEFKPGDPAHFIVTYGEGTYDVLLESGTFCESSGST
jgi:hypothetical protein